MPDSLKEKIKGRGGGKRGLGFRRLNIRRKKGGPNSTGQGKVWGGRQRGRLGSTDDKTGGEKKKGKKNQNEGGV